MDTITSENTVGGLVAERIDRARVFEKFGIDYCCNGNRPLTEACSALTISIDEVISALNDADSATSATDSIDFNSIEPVELIDHILSTHHEYMRQELPRLVSIAQTVADAHADKDSRVLEINSVIREMAEELMEHMAKEEQILFPFIRDLAEKQQVPFAPFGSMANPIKAMESEHDDAGRALERLRVLTNNYTVPEWACRTYEVLMESLQKLEWDLHQHIHKENNILFPKAIAMETLFNQ
jgi:regulator of cell morphogenesis and NO signaling